MGRKREKGRQHNAPLSSTNTTIVAEPANRTLRTLDDAIDLAMVCIDEDCNRYLLPVLDSDGICVECGGQMYEEDELDFEDVEDELDMREDVFHAVSERQRGQRWERGRNSVRFDEPDAIWPRDRSGDRSGDRTRMETDADRYRRNFGHAVSQGSLWKGTGLNGIAQVTSAPAKTDDTFSCPSDLSGCPIAAKAKVQIPLRMFRDWVILAERFDTEWIQYLYGREVEGQPNTIEITGGYFPEQKANGTHVEAADGAILPGTIAAVHSHVGMNAFFSSEDIAHFNHRIEMVINRRGDIKANGRVKLECGRFHRAECGVEFIEDEAELTLEKQLRSVLSKDDRYGVIYQSQSQPQGAVINNPVAAGAGIKK